MWHCYIYMVMVKGKVGNSWIISFCLYYLLYSLLFSLQICISTLSSENSLEKSSIIYYFLHSIWWKFKARRGVACKILWKYHSFQIFSGLVKRIHISFKFNYFTNVYWACLYTRCILLFGDAGLTDSFLRLDIISIYWG